MIMLSEDDPEPRRLMDRGLMALSTQTGYIEPLISMLQLKK